MSRVLWGGGWRGGLRGWEDGEYEVLTIQWNKVLRMRMRMRILISILRFETWIENRACGWMDGWIRFNVLYACCMYARYTKSNKTVGYNNRGIIMYLSRTNQLINQLLYLLFDPMK